MESTNEDLFQIISEKIITNDDKIILTKYALETKYPPNKLLEVRTDNKTIIQILRIFENITVYHFPNTTHSSGMRLGSSRKDNQNLKEDASNLASILYK